jgi:MFS family permease
MRGRVVAIYGIIFRGGPAIGGLAMGWIAEWTGLSWPVAGGGLISVLVWFWVVGRLGNVNRVLERGIPEEPNK